MNRTKIEYCDFSWNPIKGLCPEACWYCYARRYYDRFWKMNYLPRLDKNELMAPVYSHPNRPAGSRIFVCSTFEIFSPVADPWRDEIFKVIEFGKRDTFIILTKRPELIDRPMPDNVWLGTTVTGFDDYTRKILLMKQKAKVRFASYEPMLNPLPAEFFYGLDWAILGRLTGHGKTHDPDRSFIESTIRAVRLWNIPVFLKNNLKNIWPGPLIQEFPK